MYNVKEGLWGFHQCTAKTDSAATNHGNSRRILWKYTMQIRKNSVNVVRNGETRCVIEKGVQERLRAINTNCISAAAEPYWLGGP
jgi:hypothetical protein